MSKSVYRVLLAASLLVHPSCREKVAPNATSGPAPVIARELTDNRMKDAPHGLLASRSASPVHWQHWEPAVLARAGDARRLVFAFIGSAQYPGCLEALDLIDRDPALVARLNGEFVPVLVDTDLCREASLAAGLLSQEIRLPVGFPFILVLSPDGNEVTWRPVNFTSGGDLRDLFDGAADVVSRMWSESPDYVKRNSGLDHANRLKRMPDPDPVPATPDERAKALAAAERKLVSLYDADISSLSGTGGLLPTGILQCLASASLDPATPPSVAERCREAVSAFGETLLYSAMIDPLDGGVYSSRRGKSWNLPVIHRTCMAQARTARALVTLHSATRDPRALEVARGAVNFAEEQYRLADGLFSDQRQPLPVSQTDWLWTLEQIRQVLDPKEAALWIARCKVSELGNLADVGGGDLFRLNSLGFQTTLEEAAEAAGLAPGEAAAILESGRKKLLKAREQRLPTPAPARGPSAAPSFRMVSSYAALFTATGDAAWREKAVALAESCRERFSQADLLIERNPPVPAEICDARAFTYALAIQAALDLAEITLDEKWRIWAGDFATIVAENFATEDGRLLEARPSVTPLQLPVEDRMMLFDDSTVGLMRMNLARLEALGQTPPPAIAPWMETLPMIATFPVVFTDTILATSFARSRVILELPADASPAWREAASRLPLDRIARRIGHAADVTAHRPDGTRDVIDEPDNLAEAILPSRF